MPDVSISAVFRHNLHRLMREEGYSLEKLGRSLRLSRSGRKWLTRIYCFGLARPNSRTESKLIDLASLLRISTYRELWESPRQDVRVIEINPTKRWPKGANLFRDILRVLFADTKPSYRRVPKLDVAVESMIKQICKDMVDDEIARDFWKRYGGREGLKRSFYKVLEDADFNPDDHIDFENEAQEIMFRRIGSSGLPEVEEEELETESAQPQDNRQQLLHDLLTALEGFYQRAKALKAGGEKS